MTILPNAPAKRLGAGSEFASLDSLSLQSSRHGRGRVSSVPHDKPRGDLPHFGPRPNSLDFFTQFVSRQKLVSKAGSTFTGLPDSRVKSLAKLGLTSGECRPSLALVECFRMPLQGLTASCYAAGLHCPCKATPSPKSRDLSPAPTYPYEQRQKG